MDAIEQKMADVPAWEKNLLWTFWLAARDSPWLNNTQKRLVENKVMDIAEIYSRKDYL